MPLHDSLIEWNLQQDIHQELYDQSKHRRSTRTTNKCLRHLRSFERKYYKKTFEVKKTGHNLEPEHRLNDGNLRHTTPNLTYSMNKKKRWLLPKIIEERILEQEPSSTKKTSSNNDETFDINERLKIEMYENENVSYKSTCLRYGNSQTTPHIIGKVGQRFNSTSLNKWINFNTRNWGRHRQNQGDDHVNQPNFGLEQRPGFFPSEVTYEFLYPRCPRSTANHKGGKSSLIYRKSPRDDYYSYVPQETRKHRRFLQRIECSLLTKGNQFLLNFDEQINEEICRSIVSQESDNQSVPKTEYSIDYFIPTHRIVSRPERSSIPYDYKAQKFIEPPPTIPTTENSSSLPVNEKFLCSISCKDETDFICTMQLTGKHLTQANLSPAVFVQKTNFSNYSVVYKYSRSSSKSDVNIKYSDSPPTTINVQSENITLNTLVDQIYTELTSNENFLIKKSIPNVHFNVDALRGSLPLPLTVTEKCVLVRPSSTDKRGALRLEGLIDDSQSDTKANFWFDTTVEDGSLFECSICCEPLTHADARQLLPCQHTLCEECCSSFIRTSVSNAIYSSSATGPLTCFYTDCSTPLNFSLIQAFVSYDTYQTYRQSMVDRQLFSSGHYRQCPSQVCSNLLIIDDPAQTSLMCSCGQRVCSKCLEEYHFPATCEQYKSYSSRLRDSGDHLLSSSKFQDNSYCYIAEGKNCPNCGEFVEKNGGCPHMTCKCGNEYCWMCLKRWATHNYSMCFTIPESTHELRSSTRNRLHNKAVNHRRQRNQYSCYILSSAIEKSKLWNYQGILLSTYIDLNTLAEFLYVVLQRRRTNVNIRAVLSRTAKQLESDALIIKIQVESQKVNINHIEKIRNRLARTLSNLLHMKKNNILI